MVIAHSSHWLVNLAYIAPVLGFLVWLGFATLKQRRATAAEERRRASVSEPVRADPPEPARAVSPESARPGAPEPPSG